MERLGVVVLSGYSWALLSAEMLENDLKRPFTASKPPRGKVTQRAVHAYSRCTA